MQRQGSLVDSSSGVSRCSYDVFLSFRGTDTRTSFTDHLYAALVRAGFRTFKDDDEISAGENIKTELQKAIRESEISIVIFSKDYASSRWCLDELVEIVERKESSAGHHVLPVFYDVDPSQVRHQSDGYAESFYEHEKFHQVDRVIKWRKALRQTADLTGMVLGSRRESIFVEDIVKEIRKKLNKLTLHVPSHLVGNQSTVHIINQWIQAATADDNIATISGVGGIGKTTIAKKVYNDNFVNFESSSFLADVTQASREFNGFVRLQSQLLTNLLKKEGNTIWNVDEGLMRIKAVLCSKRVLIVLDDINDSDQLKKIIGMREWLYPGSKILITTRHKELTGALGDCKRFELTLLDADESIELLSFHAFGETKPTEGYQELADRLLQHCGGLPLALEIIGASLYGKSPDLWRGTLEKLEEIMNDKIQGTLAMSYHLLADDHDKRLFLDIACFFVGKDVICTSTILKGCGYHVAIGFQNLIDRRLLSFGMHRDLQMHQLVRDMGREIVRQESPEDPEDRSRLWNDREALKVLTNEIGTTKVKGLSINMKMLKDSLNKNDHADLEEVRTKAFKGMKSLKLLRIDYVGITGKFEKMPRSLVWLSWHGIPFQSIPEEFYLSNLTTLEMPHGMLDRNWKSKKEFGLLKFLDLSNNDGFVKTPDFTGLPSLKILILKNCQRLVEIDDTIALAKQLYSLNLSGCTSLLSLSKEVCTLQYLEELDLSYCTELHDFPMEVYQMQSLSLLRLDGVTVNDAKGNTDNSSKSLTTSFSRFLQKLCLASSNLTDDAIGNIDFGQVTSLQNLDLRNNPFRKLPEAIVGLAKLETLNVSFCEELESIAECPTNLKYLVAHYCKSLESVTNLPALELPPSYSFLGCEKLTEIEGLVKLRSMTQADVNILSKLGIFKLESLDTHEFRLYDAIGNTTRKGSLQMLHEGGISSFFIAGSNIPSWYTNKAFGTSVFQVHPSTDGKKLTGFNMCVVFERNSGEVQDPLHVPDIVLLNKKTGKSWQYTPSFWGIQDDVDDLLWFSHWKIDNTIIGDGAEVLVGVSGNAIKVKEYGVHIVHQAEEEEEKEEEHLPLEISNMWHQALMVSPEINAMKIGDWAAPSVVFAHHYRQT